MYEEDFVSRVNEITSGKGVEVVYDSVGKDTFEVMKIMSGILDFLLLTICRGGVTLSIMVYCDRHGPCT